MTTIVAYQKAFKSLSHRVNGSQKNFFIGCFIAGLHDDIRLDVKTKHTNTLEETINMARLIKEQNQLIQRVI